MDTTTHGLDQVVVVLDETQNLVNIAAVVRAMKNMGLRRLRLVNPAEFDAWRITGIAHRTDDILEQAQFFESLEDALADVVFAVGTSARARAAGRNYIRPAEAADSLLSHAAGGSVALVFGREDRGLSNEALDRCHVVAVVPTDAAYSSLNLAQACLVFLYELYLRAGDAERPLPKGKRATEPATGTDLEEMYRALEGGLETIEFFNARKPESVLRTLRKILGQADLDRREARLVAGIGYETRHFVRRIREAADRHPSCTNREAKENPSLRDEPTPED